MGNNNIEKEVLWRDNYGLYGHIYGNYQKSKLANSISIWVPNKNSRRVQ